MTTRDEGVAEQIGKAQEFVGQLQKTLRDFVADARANDATGHAALYNAVEESLDAAWNELGDAYDTMKNGDPEHYS